MKVSVAIVALPIAACVAVSTLMGSAPDASARASGFYLYASGSMNPREAATLAVKGSGRTAVLETLRGMKTHGVNHVTAGAAKLTVEQFSMLATNADPLDAPTPDFTKHSAAGADRIPSTAGEPTTFPVFGGRINNNRTWSMKNMYIQVSYCTTSGCTVQDKVTATTMNTDPGTNGFKSTATLLDWSSRDSLTQVHFQSWLYKGSANYTVSANCGSKDCVNTTSWDSGTLSWGVKSAISMKNAKYWQAHTFWGYHAAGNAWVRSEGRTTEATCPASDGACYY